LEVAIRRLGKEYKPAKRRLDRLPRERAAIVRQAGAEFDFIPPKPPTAQEQVAVLQPLESAGAPVAAGGVEIIIDNDDADRIFGQGQWMVVAWEGNSYGPSLLHDSDANKGANVIGFVPELPAAGEYDVYMFYPAADFAATNVPVEVIHAGGTTTVTVDQRSTGGQWAYLGRFTFNQGSDGGVVIRTDETDGMVFADAVKFQAVANAPAQEAPTAAD